MSCGKTEELLRRLRRATIANKRVKVFFPALDSRPSGNNIQSRNGGVQSAIRVNSALKILDLVDNSDEVIGIDELQFFDEEILDVIMQLVKSGKKVIAAGLDLNFRGEPFGPMGELLCFADKVDKLTAICMKCGSEYGNRTQRLVDGKPVDKNSPLIMIGGDESYEARCLSCYELPDSRSTKPLKLCYTMKS
jgi:thymidine kinase